MKAVFDELTPNINYIFKKIYEKYNFTLKNIIVVPYYNDAPMHCFSSFEFGQEDEYERYINIMGDYKKLFCKNSPLSILPIKNESVFNVDKRKKAENGVRNIVNRMQYLDGLSQYQACVGCDFCLNKTDFYRVQISFQKEVGDKQQLQKRDIAYIEKEISKVFTKLFCKEAKIQIDLKEVMRYDYYTI